LTPSWLCKETTASLDRFRIFSSVLMEHDCMQPSEFLGLKLMAALRHSKTALMFKVQGPASRHIYDLFTPLTRTRQNCFVLSSWQCEHNWRPDNCLVLSRRCCEQAIRSTVTDIPTKLDRLLDVVFSHIKTIPSFG